MSIGEALRFVIAAPRGSKTGPLEPDPAEAKLIVALKRRDPSAFEQLVHAHQDRVFDFCVRMLGDRDEATDMVQDIFVSIHQNLAKFREDARLSTWIFRIAKNHCLNRLKYLQRRGRGRSHEYGDVDEAELDAAMGTQNGPDKALEAEGERALIQKAIAKLDPEHRVLVALRDIEGLSYEEIMAITELPEGTVKSRLHRARERLAEVVEALEGQE